MDEFLEMDLGDMWKSESDWRCFEGLRIRLHRLFMTLPSIKKIAVVNNRVPIRFSFKFKETLKCAKVVIFEVESVATPTHLV